MELREPVMAELQHEATLTRKMLERVPENSFAWKPHEKSRTLEEVAVHIANIPGVFIASMNYVEFDRLNYKPSATGSVLAILNTFDRNVSDSLATLNTLSDEQLVASWRYKYGEKTILEMARLAVIRTMGLNHMIHHRGQLSVYLRLLNVPLPSVYGPTADGA